MRQAWVAASLQLCWRPRFLDGSASHIIAGPNQTVSDPRCLTARCCLLTPRRQVHSEDAPGSSPWHRGAGRTAPGADGASWLDQLSEHIVQSGSVSILDGGNIAYSGRAAQRRAMSIGLIPESRLPALCILMSRFFGLLCPSTTRAVIIQEAELGLVSVAAGLVNGQGMTARALNVGMAATQTDAGDLPGLRGVPS